VGARSALGGAGGGRRDFGEEKGFECNRLFTSAIMRDRKHVPILKAEPD
jgi:hypothetical protein